MVKNLRNKFVIVTTLLMITLFGGFLLINTIYTNYWNEIEIVEMLDWIAYSGIFTSNHVDLSSEELIMDITKDESPIGGIVLDQSRKILYTQVIGAENQIEVPEDVIYEMIENKTDRRKIDNYYYFYKELNDGNILLVVMNSSLEKFNGYKVLGISLLLMSVVTSLIAITFWLSKFVTKPAEQTLIREKRFISDAGHELKTPLGAISINAQALELEYSDNIYVKNIISESKRMGRLLEKLLILAKLDEQEKKACSDINLSYICEEMALTYESVVFEKKVNFTFDISPKIHIMGIEDDIRQLLAILIDNAIKNTETSGSISLSCIQRKKHAEIKVANTGKGISEETLPHIFERFYTSDSSRSSGSFGLGLAIAKSIVELHKGSIDVESMPDKMTVFTVTF